MTVGVLGGGQLGRMLALAGYPLGLRFRFFEPAEESCVDALGERPLVLVRLRITQIDARGYRTAVSTPVLVRGDERWRGLQWREEVSFSARLRMERAMPWFVSLFGQDTLDLLELGLGGPLSGDRLAEAIAGASGSEVPVGELDITMYRDDLRPGPARALLPTEIPAGAIHDNVVVLVAALLCGGRTLRAATATNSERRN